MGSGCSPGGAHPPGSEPKALGWRTKPLVGWWSQTKRDMAPRKEIPKEKRNVKGKREVGRKRRTPPSQTELEEESSPSVAAGAALRPCASRLAPPPYIVVV